MSKRASEAALSALHAKLADTLVEIIDEGITEITKEGEVVKLTAPAAILNVARQFLKDNHIEALPGSGTAFDKLAATMASLENDESAE